MIDRRCALFWGDTGTGKTYMVFDNFGTDEIYSVMDTSTPWFDGYSGEKIVLFDEMGEGCMNINKLKMFLDRYPCAVPVKGSSMAWEAETVILTSNTHYSAWWKPGTAKHADFQAIERRLKVFKFPEERDAALAWVRNDRNAAPAGQMGNPVIIPSESDNEETEPHSSVWDREINNIDEEDVLDLSQ